MKNLFGILLFISLSPHLLAASYPVMRVIQKDFPDMIGYFPPVMIFPLCGVGSEYFDRDSWGSTTTASMLNSTFSPVAPTLTTMNMSGCKGPKSIVEHQPIEKFTSDNLSLLAQEISQGSGGERVLALLGLLKIEKLDYPRTIYALKNNFKLLFPVPTVSSSEFLNNLAWIMSRENVPSPLVRNYAFSEVFEF